MNTYVAKMRNNSAILALRRVSWRRALGLLICFSGSIILLASVIDQLIRGNPNMHAGLIGGGTAAAATALGTLPVLFSQNFSQRTHDCFLGFGAGVMLAACSFSLIVPAIAAAKGSGAGPFEASALAAGGIILGGLLMLWLGHLASDDPSVLGEGARARDAMKRAWLFVAAVALHNLPEGLAIGVAYAGPDIEKAHSLATGIAIQDVPEGLVVALALRGVGYGRFASVGFGIASGIIEPVAAACGVALISMAAGLLPVGLTLAAGAMLFVIVNDVIPESHRNNNGSYASVALVAGFILMTFMDTALG